MKKFVYSFNEGSKDMSTLLGAKGASLAEMTRIGLPVPFGFTVTTEACNKYYEDGNTISEETAEELSAYLADLEEITGKKFGEASNPLLLSVRSGSAFSMPGMLDTILNIGINDETVKGLARATENERFAYDSYRRLIEMFGNIVFEIPKDKFDEAFSVKRELFKCSCETDVCTEALQELVEEYKRIIKENCGKDFPQDVKTQLMTVLSAFFESWNSETNVLYREFNKIPHEAGIALCVQHMVFGNTGEESGTGVAFTRNPHTGEDEITGDFLFNAQGEDVVNGDRLPEPVTVLEKRLPTAYKQFVKIAKLLENHYKDMQCIEFTIEDGRLYILQTRTSTRTSVAAMKIAVDMEGEGLIDRKTALMRVKPAQLEMLIAQANDAQSISDLFRSESYISFMKWADELRTLRVRATVEDVEDVKRAFEFGAEGIGLFRTEKVVLDSINSPDSYEYMKEAFKTLFEITGDRAIGIRLFNPVFSESVPTDSYELIEKQAKAIVAAAVELKKEKHIDAVPGIIVPLIGLDKEYATVRSIVVNAIDKYLEDEGEELDYSIGPMVDVPRVALTAPEIAKEADFFSFELDNLTHRTFGFSMDEPIGFITKYRESIELDRDMFTGFDAKGVGKLIKDASEAGKAVKGNIKLGICKEFGVDLDMIDFCCASGFNYISCSPESIPVSKLAATQATIQK